jgi:regulator of RNase E activity RraB
MATDYHREDFDSEESWQLEAFRLGYDNAEQREYIIEHIGSDMASDLIQERFDQGDFQSLGDIYADLWDSLYDMDPADREDLINELFGYETA